MATACQPLQCIGCASLITPAIGKVCVAPKFHAGRSTPASRYAARDSEMSPRSENRMRVYILIAFAWLTVTVIIVLIGTPTKRVVWSKQGGVSPPPRFIVLLFPRHGEAICAECLRNIQPRAIAVSLTEQLQDSVEVFSNNLPFSVDRSCLQPLPGITPWNQAIAAWQAEVQTWGSDTDWPAVSASLVAGATSNRPVIEVQRKSRKGSSDYYTYTLDHNGDFEPLAWHRASLFGQFWVTSRFVAMSVLGLGITLRIVSAISRRR